VVLAASTASAKSIVIKTTPPGASIFRVASANGLVLLGVGSARLKLEGASSNEVLVTLDGFEPVRRSFRKAGPYPGVVDIPLPNRLVKLTVNPADAEILQDGVLVGKEKADIVVAAGKSVTVTAKKLGFAAVSATYDNKEGAKAPPVTDHFEVTDRAIFITASPAGTAILVDSKPVGETTAEVVIPDGRCVMVKLTLRGFAELEKPYCNKTGTREPPLQDEFVLRDRMVAVRAVPADATIMVNGQEAGKGEFQVTVPEGESVSVAVSAAGYVTRRKQYWNQANSPKPPAEDRFQLPVDDAFANSVRSDQAGATFILQPSARDKAWQTLTIIVQTFFEDIESRDKESGYLRTAWKLTSFPNCSVRTRVIVTLTDPNVPRFRVQVASEYSTEGGVSVRCDDCFKPWDRTLREYVDMINELKARIS